MGRIHHQGKFQVGMRGNILAHAPGKIKEGGHSVGAACIPHRNDKANAGARRDTHHCERPGIDLIIHGTGAGAEVEFFGLIGTKSENKTVDLTMRAAVVARRKERKICIYGDG